ncbi:MAG: hypothetical protein M3552_19125 [Planctomycetota bacterium]|nr:hypothetical protein [Planctomycetaceae bacterium]MDQ3332729.1 hypothetical protein [Planctomycetota bacterium]
MANWERERHVSPDGLLALVVMNQEKDLCVGFEGSAWHVHADQLANAFRCSEEEAIRQFTDDIIESRVPIAVCRASGKIETAWAFVWPADVDLKPGTGYQEPGETIEYRYWNGRPWTPC